MGGAFPRAGLSRYDAFSLASGEAMRRSEFIKGIAGTAAWPLTARAQQGERMRRIGVLSSGGAVDDSETKTFLAAFRQGLEQLGWTEGRNVQIDARFGQGDADRARKYAAELVALTPDVILTSGAAATEQMIKTTRTVPIVFALVPDPVGSKHATFRSSLPSFLIPLAANSSKAFR